MPLARPSDRTNPDAIAATAVKLDGRIARFIADTKHAHDEFEPLARDVFAYQYSANEPYRRYCDRLGVAPDRITRWTDIPAVPTSAFSQVRFACFPPERTKVTFLSSGTTSGNRSRLELEDLSLYDASLLAHFRRMLLPDATRTQLVVLAPPFSEAPNSSLSYMFSKISEVCGTAEDGFFMHESELDFDGAVAALHGASRPVLVAGTAFAFVHFFDRCATSDVRFALPAGSRVLETGGFKGKSRVISQSELYGWFTDVLGVRREMCVSEYGMCELGSQWYDNTIAGRLSDSDERLYVKVGPHWARTLIVDRVTAEPVAPGEAGLLQIFDLTSRGSVCAVLTGDLAIAADDGFLLLGRAPGELPKGCSIAVDAALGRA